MLCFFVTTSVFAFVLHLVSGEMGPLAHSLHVIVEPLEPLLMFAF